MKSQTKTARKTQKAPFQVRKIRTANPRAARAFHRIHRKLIVMSLSLLVLVAVGATAHVLSNFEGSAVQTSELGASIQAENLKAGIFGDGLKGQMQALEKQALAHSKDAKNPSMDLGKLAIVHRQVSFQASQLASAQCAGVNVHANPCSGYKSRIEQYNALIQTYGSQAKDFKEIDLKNISVGAGTGGAAGGVPRNPVSAPCEGLGIGPINNINIGLPFGKFKIGDCAQQVKPTLDGPGAVAGLNKFASQYKGNTYGSAVGMLAGWTNFVLPFVSLLAIAAIIYAGFLYITALGNDEQTSKAKDIILWVVVGIIVILSAYAIVNTVLGGSAT